MGSASRAAGACPAAKEKEKERKKAGADRAPPNRQHPRPGPVAGGRRTRPSAQRGAAGAGRGGRGRPRDLRPDRSGRAPSLPQQSRSAVPTRRPGCEPQRSAGPAVAPLPGGAAQGARVHAREGAQPPPALRACSRRTCRARGSAPEGSRPAALGFHVGGRGRRLSFPVPFSPDLLPEKESPQTLAMSWLNPRPTHPATLSQGPHPFFIPALRVLLPGFTSLLGIPRCPAAPSDFATSSQSPLSQP